MFQMDELNKVWEDLNPSQFTDEGQTHFYCHNQIGDVYHQLQTTEDKLKEGGQSYDLNPVIFYRTKSAPLENGAYLPSIELRKIFDGDRTVIREIEFLVRKKVVTEEEIEEALEKASQPTKDSIDKLQNITAQ